MMHKRFTSYINVPIIPFAIVRRDHPDLMLIQQAYNVKGAGIRLTNVFQSDVFSEKEVKTYDHAFTIAFSVKNSISLDASDVTDDMLRSALLRRIADLDDAEHECLTDACDAPYDTYEER